MTINIKDIDIYNNFIDKIENINRTYLIYRMIIVYKNNAKLYKFNLENYDNSVYIVKDLDIDFDKLDYRILMVHENDIHKIANKGYYYNLITFTPCCTQYNINKNVNSKIIIYE